MSAALAFGDGDCYVVAGRHALDYPDSQVAICHGTAVGQGPIKGIAFGHAWLEAGDIVIDLANGKDIRMTRDVYYALGQIKDVTRYTVDEARHLMLTTGQFGPWKEQST